MSFGFAGAGERRAIIQIFIGKDREKIKYTEHWASELRQAREFDPSAQFAVRTAQTWRIYLKK
jgi:hypothetical protein